jgi:hypothetical protein
LAYEARLLKAYGHHDMPKSPLKSQVLGKIYGIQFYQSLQCWVLLQILASHTNIGFFIVVFSFLNSFKIAIIGQSIAFQQGRSILVDPKYI